MLIHGYDLYTAYLRCFTFIAMNTHENSKYIGYSFVFYLFFIIIISVICVTTNFIIYNSL